MAVCSRSLPGVEYEDIISEQGILNKDIKTKRAVKIGIKFLPGDVLFGKLRPYLKNWLLPDFTGVAVGDFWVLQPSEIDSQYLYYLIQTPAFQEVSNQSTGTKMPRADWNLVANSMFFLPQNDDEQTCIGTFFRQLDRLITLHQCNCNMATRPCEWSSGLRAIAWEQRKLGEIVKIRRGLTYKPSDICENGIRVLRSSNIDGDSFVLNCDDVFVREQAVNIDYARENDILITAANGSSRLVGKHAILSQIPDKSTVHGGFMLLGSTEEPYFINASMGSSWYRRFVELFVAGGNGAIGNLNKNDLDNQDIFVPSKKEQARIGAFFRHLDRLVALHQRKHILLT